MPRLISTAGQPCRLAVVLCIALALLLIAACGGRGPATSAGAPAISPPAPTAAPAATSTAPAATAQPSATTAATAPTSPNCISFPEGQESTRALDPNRTLCSFRDAQGREVQLTAGRSSRGLERGEFGWAHIRDKHFYGLWEAGGALTRFSVVGARTEDDVIARIGDALQDPRPSTSADNRREYRRSVAGAGFAVLVVVGDNGRIITAYPVPEARR